MTTKYYILIDPFTNKPIEFSEFPINDKVVVKSSTLNGKRQFETKTALCLEIDMIDPTLLEKEYNPKTGSFV